jgi:formate dehydrogenase subunit gamma
MAERYIKRHSKQTRITHGIVVIACIWLMISGLFVFVPPLAAAVGDGVTRAMRVSHRIVGCIFILAPIVSACLAPGGFKAFLRKYFTKWTPQDFEFMKKFVPYMLGPKRVHMPDQDEVKSGQRIADGMLILGGIAMAVSGLVLLLGTSVFHASAGALLVMRFVHDLFFILLVIFVVAHIYLGAGIFQPYRGTLRLMWGDGKVSESNALYHWGFWAREELEKGDNVVVEETK